MNVIRNCVLDSFICEKDRFEDERGFFQELFSQKHLPDFKCLQINYSKSKKNVLRGLHVVPFGKLVTCVKGKIFDVVADVRPESRTYLQWYGLELSEDNNLSLYIPPHCAHGFLALNNDSMIVYAQDGLYDPKIEFSINYNDPILKVAWPGQNFILSTKDRDALCLTKFPFVVK